MFRFLIHNKVQVIMNYNLNASENLKEKKSTWAGISNLMKLVVDEKKQLLLSLIAILFSSLLNLLGPFLIGYAIDHYVRKGLFNGVLLFSCILLGMYLLAFVSSYLQTQLMGGVAQRAIFKLRNTIFEKIQQLPVAFFNENKAGDLISRVNNDTDKLSQFFSQALMQFISSITVMTGSGLFLLTINPKLGVATLIPAIFIFLFTRIVSPWVKNKNALSLKSSGALSGEIQESLNNFKVIIAFNRRDYFRNKFKSANNENYKVAIGAGIANNIFLPVFGFLTSTAQLIVLLYGIYLISENQLSIGLLVSYLAYTTNFYNPLRQLAALWTTFQVALAGWDRISRMLSFNTNLFKIDSNTQDITKSLIEFRSVYFGYSEASEILHDVNLSLKKGKTYALVGPTGGGKTTTASLMARLYDPIKGEILFNGRDIRSYTERERSSKIGFILQDPFLFTGTIRDNITYGNERYQGLSSKQFDELILSKELQSLFIVFEDGPETVVSNTGEGLSLGQKQIIAFLRAVLREPELLILDEATANIDTITEKLLEVILQKLPEETTVIIIAHRLNTIKNADEIYFVNNGTVYKAGSFKDAMNKLIHQQRKS
jgi:ATP-binding cassette subfamily B protein